METTQNRYIAQFKMAVEIDQGATGTRTYLSIAVDQAYHLQCVVYAWRTHQVPMTDATC